MWGRGGHSSAQGARGSQPVTAGGPQECLLQAGRAPPGPARPAWAGSGGAGPLRLSTRAGRPVRSPGLTPTSVSPQLAWESDRPGQEECPVAQVQVLGEK